MRVLPGQRGGSWRTGHGALLLHELDEEVAGVEEAVDAVGETALLLSGEAGGNRADASRQRENAEMIGIQTEREGAVGTRTCPSRDW